MNESPRHPRWALPYRTDSPSDPQRAGRLRVARIAAYVLFAAALIVPAVQLEVKTLENQAEYEEYRRQAEAGELTAAERQAGPPKGHKGAINRWRSAFEAFWRGENIYLTPEQYSRANVGRDIAREDVAVMHPNMPFTVILLSPFELAPVWLGTAAFSAVKILLALLALLAAVRVADHRDGRMGDWVVGLAVLWWLPTAISDIQHANTNLLVLAAVAGHLWLYRRGHDLLAGTSLALAICLKMTPALFVLYWLYQRNWTLLRGTLAAGLAMVIVIPALTLGPTHYTDLMGTWYENLIRPGLMEGGWYPINVNQSLPSTVGRYLLDGHPGGDYHWNPDDHRYDQVADHAWIAFASLNPATVKGIIRVLQAAIVILAGWAIGWRKLPRDDARRGLHYALVLAAILLLNQRTWDHHATVLLPGLLAIWCALAYGRMSPRTRVVALTLTLLGGAVLWLSAGEMLVAYGRLGGLDGDAADAYADRLLAYGPRMYYFLLAYLAALVCAFGLKRLDDPYSERRQPVLAKKEQQG